MDNIEKVRPVTVDGIEFYVTNDGKEAGVSISGLARLCGVSQQTISELIKIIQGEATGRSIPKSLEPFTGRAFNLQAESFNGAKILVSEMVVGSLEYYAFESRVANDTAKTAYRYFANKGFIKTVCDMTGFEEPKKEPDVNAEILAEILKEVRELKQFKNIAVEHVTERNITKISYPNLDWFLDDCIKSNLLHDGKYITIKSFIKSKKLNPTHGLKIRLGQLVAETYKTTTGKEPTKITIKKSKEEGGGYEQNISAYPSEYINLIEMCWRKLI